MYIFRVTSSKANENLLAIQIRPFRLSMRIKELVSCSKSVLSRSVRCLLSKTRHIFSSETTEAQDLRFTIFWKEKKKQLNFYLPQVINAVLRQPDMFKVCFVCYCVRANQEKTYGWKSSPKFYRRSVCLNKSVSGFPH